MRTIRRRNPARHSEKIAITTRYMGGSRVLATAGMGRRASTAYDFGLNADKNHARAAEALCKKMDWTGDLIGGTLGDNKGMVWVFTS